VRRCTRSRGRVGWAGKRVERAGTGEVLDGRPGADRELGGAEVIDAKRGKLDSGVHPLEPRKVVDSGGCHTPFQDSGNEASIRVLRMFHSHV
jgi:hypothetical protein